ncbi:MAG: DUF3108 domain-containing protein, partial [Zoogloeaceae bacterium]|nr:DUF3108 domain-containing protein [Zoogloeaceae bacterium]
IFWLLKPVQMTNVSKGEIVAGGFRPNEFSVTRFNGKNETAAFDWAANEVRRDNGERYPLEAGTQDMLSMFWQLALLPLNGATVSLPVATGKGVELYEFTIVGRETLDLPLGAVATVHLANRQPSSKESTDLWLALEKDKLPVRMRFIDRKGNVFDQLAESIALEEKEGKR